MKNEVGFSCNSFLSVLLNFSSLSHSFSIYFATKYVAFFAIFQRRRQNIKNEELMSTSIIYSSALSYMLLLLKAATFRKNKESRRESRWECVGSNNGTTSECRRGVAPLDPSRRCSCIIVHFTIPRFFESYIFLRGVYSSSMSFFCWLISLITSYAN